MPKPNFGRRFQSMHAAGKTAKPIYVCRGCGTWHDPVAGHAPLQCMNSGCGRMDFDRFMSKVEATKWAALLLAEKLGKITKLEKQVRFPLYAYGPDGERVEVAVYIADFVYVSPGNGRTHVVDVKPKRGIDDLAKLKLKWMFAQGILVEIVT